MAANVIADLPTYDTSAFGGEAESHFFFDLVRLQDRDDLPRTFPHRHNYYHLLWMTRAQGTHMLDFDSFEIRDHTVFFVSPRQIHAWYSKVRPEGYVINFSTEFFVQLFPRADIIAQFPFYHIANDHPVMYLEPTMHDALLPLLQEIEAESRGDLPGRFDVIRSYFLILLSKLRRLYPARDGDAGSPQHYRLTKRFKLLIEDHFLDLGAMQEYAGKLHVTERQLNEATKRTIGRTASQMVHERIVLEAKRLLINTDMAIAEIAYQLNFEDLAYFCRFFKKHTQMTPGDFKKRYSGPII